MVSLMFTVQAIKYLLALIYLLHLFRSSSVPGPGEGRHQDHVRLRGSPRHQRRRPCRRGGWQEVKLIPAPNPLTNPSMVFKLITWTKCRPKTWTRTTLLCPKILNWIFEHHNIEYNTKFSWAKWHVYVFAFLVVVVICLPSMFFHCHTYVAQSFPSQCVLQEILSLKNNFCYHPCKGLNFRFSRKIGWSWFKLQVLVENLQSQTWQAYICWGYVFVNCIFVRKNPCFVYLWIAYLKEIDGEKLYLLIYVACIGGGGSGGAWVWRILEKMFHKILSLH